MSQFCVYENRDRASTKRFPYLLDVQHDFLSSLSTRMVIPLGLKNPSSPLAEQERLILSFKIEGQEVLLMTPQMAGVALSQLGEQVDDLSYCRDDIVGAMDFLVFGYLSLWVLVASSLKPLPCISLAVNYLAANSAKAFLSGES